MTFMRLFAKLYDVKKIKSLISDKTLWIVIFALFPVIVGIQALVDSSDAAEKGPYTIKNCTSYNNYVIFKQSFFHLIHDQDLYVAYPDEHWDLYKYTPTFAAFCGIFSFLPDWLGLNLWYLFNAFIFLLAVFYLPGLNDYKKGLVLLICVIELLTSILNEQSNGLMAGLLILSFGLIEKKRYFLSAACIVFSIYVKLFGIVGCALFLFYPKKWKLATYFVFWTVVLFLLPLLFVGPEHYVNLWQSYRGLLSNDFTGSQGFSVMGWLHAWFGLQPDKSFVILFGAAVFLVPMYRVEHYRNPAFRILALASILLWIVIFNHKAESPTFIIAMAGVALWFVTMRLTVIDRVLFTFAVVFTVLSPTDIFPRFLREHLVKPYSLKVFPCIAIWVKIIYDMITMKKMPLLPNPHDDTPGRLSPAYRPFTPAGSGKQSGRT